MGNNRSSLQSGSAATNTSTNSNISIPSTTTAAKLKTTNNTNNSGNIQAGLNGNEQTSSSTSSGFASVSNPSATSSSVSFLKRFRSGHHHHPNSSGLEDDNKENNTKKSVKKSKKLVKSKKKKTKEEKSTIPLQPAIEQAPKILNESEYTSINDYMGDVLPKQEPDQIIKEESFYESTFDMDLAVKPENHLEHQQLYSDLNNNVQKNPVILDTNANLYSEVPSKNSISKGSHIGELLNTSPSTSPASQINKKKTYSKFLSKTYQQNFETVG